MINITAILTDALADFPYPTSEAPMKEIPDGIYASWQPGAISRKNASGVCFEETQTADIGLIIPDGMQYAGALSKLLDLLQKCSKIRYAKLEDVQFLPDIQKRCLTIRVLAIEKEADT